MPSWNIHIAQTEGLLLGSGPVSRAVCDRNAFLFGNVVPDIFVGYMVPGVASPIPYVVTHFASHEPIPKPREQEFWHDYVVPLLEAVASGDAAAPECPSSAVEPGAASALEGQPAAAFVPVDAPLSACRSMPAESKPGPLDAATCCGAPNATVFPTTKTQELERLNRVHYPHRYEGAPPVPGVPSFELSTAPADVLRSTLDLTLGVWAHLVADNIWNMRVNEFLDATGEKPSEQFRIKKQGDFDWFGKTLAIDSVPRATERLYQAASAFPQYSIDREYVLKTIGVMHEIVRSNPGDPHHPPYRLLTDEFFERVFAEVIETTDELFAARTAGQASPNR